MVSISSSSVCGTSLESFKHRFCNWFWYLLCMYLGPSTMYTISPILFLIIPRSQQDVLFWYFFSWVEPFLGANVVFRSLFCFGSSLSKTDLIFLANIVSAGETASGVLGLGVILYTYRNCCSALSVRVPDAFLCARFNVSTKRSVWPFDLGWYCSVVMCFIWKISPNSLNSTDVNWLPLSLTTQSTTLNRADSSCRNPIVVPVVGLLHLRISGHLE